MTVLELQLLTTEELTSELSKRFDVIMIYGLQKGIKPGVSNYYDHYIGDQATLIGLCELMKEKIKGDFVDNTLSEEKG